MSASSKTDVLAPPLPGGAEATTVSVRGLLTGTMDGPEAWFYGERGPLGSLRALGVGAQRRWHRFPVSAFLITHPAAGSFLLDTGFADGACEAPVKHLGFVGTRVFKHARASRAGTVNRQLQELGVEVDLVVMTHLHWDHAGALREFLDARVLVARAEWAAAHRRASNMRGYLRRQFAGCRRVSLLDFAGPNAEPWGAFRHTIDLFGDGSVRLLSTPGHSPGHLSVLLRLRDRLALLAGDALYTMRTLELEHHPWQLGDARAYGESIACISAFARAHPHALVLPGHDLQAWRQSGIEESL
jgi:N-acyl homoserine lactone hydrolase